VLAALLRFSQPVGFAITLANKDGYQDSILLSGLPIGAAEAALDTACGLSSTGLSAWS
jgi:hypothetical protein